MLAIVAFVAIVAIAVYYFQYYKPAQSANTPPSGAKLPPSPTPVNGAIIAPAFNGAISGKSSRRAWISALCFTNLMHTRHASPFLRAGPQTTATTLYHQYPHGQGAHVPMPQGQPHVTHMGTA